MATEEIKPHFDPAWMTEEGWEDWEEGGIYDESDDESDLPPGVEIVE